MGGEPWCLTPDAIAGLTDWQVEHLYVRPAAERAGRARAESGGPGPAPAAAPPDGPSERAAAIDCMVRECGYTPDEAAAAYDAVTPRR